LDKECIVQVALDLVNKEGLDKLTMRRLAESLGIQAASLYWHVSDKAELLQLMADNICDRIIFPDLSLPWKEQLLAVANRYRGVLLSIPDSARILADTVPSTPTRLRQIEATYRLLTYAGFSPEVVASAASLFNNYIVSFVMDEMIPVRLANEQGKRVEEVYADARRMFQSLPTDKYPLFVSLAEYAASQDIDKQFQFGLQVLLEGLEARLTAHTKSV
jgi:AcrR family transcriptional regulator